MTTWPAAFGISGIEVQTNEPREFWIDGGILVDERPAAAEVVAKDVWVTPGFVDAHCHIGLDAGGAVDRPTTEAQALTDRNAGTLLVRDTGVPTDTRWVDDRSDLPRIIRSGRHIARPKRYIRNFAVEIEPEELPDEVRRQAARGDGWVKVVGDWIERSAGDLEPLWPTEIVNQAVQAAHEAGAKLQVHTFSEAGVEQFVTAGADCIEHGTGLSDDLIAIMAKKNIALVPTMINLANFPMYASQGQEKFPTYAAHMLDLYGRVDDTMRKCLEAGVQIYSGTDAGGTIKHGRIREEIAELTRIGGAEFALGAASWRARSWLGADSLTVGSSADLLIFDVDPRQAANALPVPHDIVLRGQRVA